jgi:hypothetical protein
MVTDVECRALDVRQCGVVRCSAAFGLYIILFVAWCTAPHLSKEKAAEEEVDDEKSINKCVEPLNKGEDGRAWSNQDFFSFCIQNYCLAQASSSVTSLFKGCAPSTRQ